jgi:TolB protein
MACPDDLEVSVMNHKKGLRPVAYFFGILLVCAAVTVVWGQPAGAPLGIFQAHGDIGTVLHPGTVVFDPVTGNYTVSGSGNNMWLAEDDFQFVWRKVSSNAVTLTADVAFAGKGVEAHRKAVLLIRQNLDADSAYVDVARHGNGLTALQWRDRKGANTDEIRSHINAPERVRLVKRGPKFYMFVAAQDGKLQMAGGPIRLRMMPPFYVGIGVCSHNKNVIETAVFSHVQLTE